MKHSKLIIYTILLLLGSLLAFGTIPIVFKYSPNELSRISFIHNSLNSSAEPRILIFGNSIVMNGIDTEQIEQVTQHQPIWNCSSTGQSILEAYLFLQSIPESVEQVWIGVLVDELFSEPILETAKYDAFVMAGFRSSESVTYVVSSFVTNSPHELLSTPPSTIQMRSRWMLRSGIDTTIRSLLRRDLTINAMRESLTFPAMYTTHAPQAQIDTQLATWIQRRETIEAAQPRIHPDTETLLLAIQEALQKHDTRLGLFVLPDHPAITAATSQEFISLIETECKRIETEHGIAVDSFVTLLSEDQFFDDAHPTREGASVLSEAFAANLTARF